VIPFEVLSAAVQAIVGQLLAHTQFQMQKQQLNNLAIVYQQLI